ncbi:hypothetical protein [Gramella sp. KN1008]|uniref:hypothetical protein n=1 Tax=Gramella sp. KN1008 TaxID=2529298 RepID=UPI0010391CE5|nr:hypothetical protein [Gramella sp. KN1008]TBW30264.1 hypothetical protein EZJ28_02360 [Gramella sp. KN1008]
MMNVEDKIYQTCMDGVPVAEVRRRSSVKFINELRENQLILITSRGTIRLTTKGKIAMRMGLSNYLSLDDLEKELLTREVAEIRSENRGLMVVLGGLVLSCLFLMGYWFLQF